MWGAVKLRSSESHLRKTKQRTCGCLKVPMFEQPTTECIWQSNCRSTTASATKTHITASCKSICLALQCLEAWNLITTKTKPPRWLSFCDGELRGMAETDEVPLQHTSIALTMEAVNTSETSANFYKTILCNSPEDCHLHTHHHENLKSHKTP